MILSALGVTPPLMWSEKTMETSVNLWTGPFEYGNPTGVAGTINRYAPRAATACARQYETLFSRTPYSATARTINALTEHGSASVAMTFQGSHWVVVVGAMGSGIPGSESDYSISGLWICNPGHNAPIEHVSYKAWLYLYLTGCANYGAEGFIIVSDARAAERGSLAPAEPEPPPNTVISGDPVPVALAGAAENGLAEYFVGGIPDKNIFIATEPAYDPYHLISFVMPNKTQNVIRLTESGAYLGASLGIPAGWPIDPTTKLDALADATLEGRGFLEESPATTDLLRLIASGSFTSTVMWHPSQLSVSPYDPFLRVSDGETSVYVSNTHASNALLPPQGLPSRASISYGSGGAYATAYATAYGDPPFRGR